MRTESPEAMAPDVIIVRFLYRVRFSKAIYGMKLIIEPQHYIRIQGSKQAPSGFEPLHDGFAIHSLSHLGTAPDLRKYKALLDECLQGFLRKSLFS